MRKVMDFLNTDSDSKDCSPIFAIGFVTNVERFFSPTCHRFSINKLILIIYTSFPKYFKAVSTKNLKISKWLLHVFCCYLLPWKVLIMFLWQLHNIGPSAINNTVLRVGWPVSSREEFLLYILHIQTHGPLHCQTSSPINTMQIKVSILFLSLSAFWLGFFSYTSQWNGTFWELLITQDNFPE